MTAEPTLDPGGIERLLEITGGDVAFVDELIATYVEDGAVQLDALRRAAEAGDIPEMVRPAHSLKSSSDNVGAVVLTTLCRALEADARAGSVASPTDRVRAIAQEFEAVRTALSAARQGR